MRKFWVSYCLSAAALAASITAIMISGCGKELVIQDGEEYSIVSFGTTDVEVKDDTSVPCYLITLTYRPKDAAEAASSEEEFVAPEDDTKSRATIPVPKENLMPDTSLPINVIVWDPPHEIEGKVYRTVRWNPARIDPARTRERIREEEPLKK